MCGVLAHAVVRSFSIQNGSSSGVSIGDIDERSVAALRTGDPMHSAGSARDNADGSAAHAHTRQLSGSVAMPSLVFAWRVVLLWRSLIAAVLSQSDSMLLAGYACALMGSGTTTA